MAETTFEASAVFEIQQKNPVFLHGVFSNCLLRGQQVTVVSNACRNFLHKTHVVKPGISNQINECLK
jgi:hypothetical protein